MLCAVSPYSVLDPLFSIPHKNDKNRSMFVHATQKQSKNSGISLNKKNCFVYKIQFLLLTCKTKAYE